MNPSSTKLPATSAAEKRQEQAAAADDVLMREVDEAVRQDQMSDMVTRYGKPIAAVLVLGLAAFGGYLYWNSQHEGDLESQSETIVAALDQVEAGNLESGSAALQPIADDGVEGAKAVAIMLQAGIAQEQGQAAEAAALFAKVAADGDTPDRLRDLAIVREVAATYDTRKPADVIARLKPLAVPGNAFFGSAGEMVAMAYLEQGKRQQAGDLFAQIARAEDVPEGLRSRTRRMAGLLGVDAIDDVNELLKEVGAPTGNSTTPVEPPPTQ